MRAVSWAWGVAPIRSNASFVAPSSTPASSGSSIARAMSAATPRQYPVSSTKPISDATVKHSISRRCASARSRAPIAMLASAKLM